VPGTVLGRCWGHTDPESTDRALRLKLKSQVSRYGQRTPGGSCGPSSGSFPNGTKMTFPFLVQSDGG
jgi:hypothetical protein